MYNEELKNEFMKGQSVSQQKRYITLYNKTEEAERALAKDLALMDK